MPAPNRSLKHRSRFAYNNLEPRRLLAAAADLIIPAMPETNYFLEDTAQESIARDYLAGNSAIANLDLGIHDLELIEIQHGLATTVTRFQQTIYGTPVVDAYVTTIQGPNGDFLQVHDQSFQGKIDQLIPLKQIDYAVTEQIALDHAGAISTFATSRGEMVWLPGQNGIAEPVWQMTVFGVTAENHGDFLTFIDPVTGKVLTQENRISHFTEGSGEVFYPNPFQTLGSGVGLADDNDADSPELTNQLVSVTLEGLDEGTGLLTGEFVDLATLNSTALPDVDANEATREYNYTRDDDRFEQVVIYHTVDQINRYFHALGFDDDTGVTNGIRDFATQANAHWYGDDQSFYSTGDDAIHFGDGGVDDGEDGDIIAHEFGHAVQHDQNAAWGSGEMGAMGEGFGDYLAASFFQTYGESTFLSNHAAAVGEWDATSYSSDSPPNLRRVDGSKTYPGDLTGAVHADGEIWSRALWDINQALGAAVADQVILESHFMLPGGASMVTAAEMILLADENINAGANADAIRQAFEDRGILEPPATIGTVKLDKSVYSVGDVISITVADFNGPATIPVTIVSSNGDAEALTLTGSAGVYAGTITSVAGTPTAADGLLQAALDDTFTVTYEDADDGMGNPVTATDTGSFADIDQYVATDTPINITDNNTITSTITVTDVGDLADIDLQLNITHTFDGDLTGVLTAPNGEQITLFERIGGAGDDYDDTLFDDDAGQLISEGSPPYSGEFRPTESFAALVGASITGDWTLSINDGAGGDIGTLNSWSLFMVSNPKPPTGTLTIDKALYEVGDVISITVGDGNGPAMIPVTITSSNGDSESLMLTGNQGLYTGTLTSVAGSPTASDGQLQAASGDTFTVTYEDTDDGTGNPLTASDTGQFIEISQYDAGDVPIDITDNATISSTITIADGGSLTDIDLQLNITHTFDGDLTGVLTAPNGEEITLFARIGGGGDDYDNTRFNDEAVQSISDGSPPYSGEFQPTESFAALAGISITGDWTLSITDSANADTGTLNAWSLFIVVDTNLPIGPVTDADAANDEAAENAIIGANVGITASAADPGDVVTYELTNDAGGLFEIGASTGIVTVAGALDFETATSHSIDVKATSSDGSSSTETFAIAVTNVDDAVITTRQIFYDNSSFDGSNDFDAVASGKQFLIDGQTATIGNYSSYWLGLNGLVLEVNDLNVVPTLTTVGDFFAFTVGNDDTTGDWQTAPAPSNLVYLPNVDANGTDRLFLSWNNNDIENEWLQITVLAGATTGLTTPDVFYFGNVIGETGNDANNAVVNLQDVAGARSNQTGFGNADIDNLFDFDRDGKVNLVDIAIARENQSGFSIVNLITPGSNKNKGIGIGLNDPIQSNPTLDLSAANNLTKALESEKLTERGIRTKPGESTPLDLSGSQVNAEKRAADSDGFDQLGDRSSDQAKLSSILDEAFKEFEFATL